MNWLPLGRAPACGDSRSGPRPGGAGVREAGTV